MNGVMMLLAIESNTMDEGKLILFMVTMLIVCSIISTSNKK